MKKTILSLIALIAITGVSSASFTGDVSQYYENNKADYTLNTFHGNISLDTPVYDIRNGIKVVTYTQDNVVCKISYNMCYTASTALRAFGLDVDAFTKGYEEVTGIKTNFVNLFKALYVAPSL